MTRVPCLKCGESVHPDTALKNDGLCMPCKGGYRDRIEDAKARREAEKAYELSAERRYWTSLVKQVLPPAAGFTTLSPKERTYYAVGCLIGEVYNGGFEQFIFNHAGSMYGEALSGLMELEANASASLLLRAKELLFGEEMVQIDTGERRAFLRKRDSPTPDLELLDKEFWKDTEKLSERCEEYAQIHRLYGDA